MKRKTIAAVTEIAATVALTVAIPIPAVPTPKAKALLLVMPGNLLKIWCVHFEICGVWGEMSSNFLQNLSNYLIF